MQKQAPILLAAAVAVLFGLWFLSRKQTPTPRPGQSQSAAGAAPPSAEAPSTTDTAVNPDLSGYPIHGAPAVPLAQGSRVNYLADFPSLITSLASKPGTTTTTPASHTGTTPPPKPVPFTEGLFAGANESIRRALDWASKQFTEAGLNVRLGSINTHASGGFNSDQFKLTDFLDKVASIPVVAVDFIGQSLLGPPPAPPLKLQLEQIT